MGKFTNKQRARIKHLVLEAWIQRFSRQESLIYVNSYLKTEGIAISLEHLDDLRKSIRKNATGRMNKLRGSRHAFLQQYFDRVDEIIHLQQKQWQMYHSHPEQPYLQKMCLTELHQLTITLANLQDMAPAISEMSGDIPDPNPNETDLPKHETLVSGQEN